MLNHANPAPSSSANEQWQQTQAWRSKSVLSVPCVHTGALRAHALGDRARDRQVRRARRKMLETVVGGKAGVFAKQNIPREVRKVVFSFVGYDTPDAAAQGRAQPLPGTIIAQRYALQPLGAPPVVQLSDHDHTRARQVWDELARRNTPVAAGQPRHEMVWYQEPEHVTPAIRCLLAATAALFARHGHACDPARWMIETWLYQVRRGEVCKAALDWHQDDGEEHGWPEARVLVALYYLRKDSGLSGGNLQYSLDSAHVRSLPATTVRVRNGLTVLMRGDVWHCPQNMSGDGERHLLLVHMKRQ